MDIYQFLYLVIAWILGVVVGTIFNVVHNRRIKESKTTVGELQVIYEEGAPNDSPLVFFVSYVPMNELSNNEAVRMIVRVKNM